MRTAAAALIAIAVLAPAAIGAGAENSCVGTMTSPANGTTIISVQGAKMGTDAEKRSARIVAVGPRGGVRWVHSSGRELGIVWSYDVDPLANGNLFVTATRPERTVFYELDPRTQERVWTEELDLVDTHDADLLDRHRILIANMRNYDETAGRNDDRLLIYNRTSDEVVWEWRFAESFPKSGGGDYAEDWTHVNDVDRIAPGEYLASVRNFDQVVVVNRTTGEVTLRLGEDDRFEVMRQQHNPQYLESRDGDPAILVADSENDRIVEYERADGGWERTWTLAGEFAWPRDADRLPNGNTLVVDSNNHRVLEVTPQGTVVWEVYSPWLIYDAERVTHGDEAGGPTIRDLGAEGSYRLSGATETSEGELEGCAASIREFDNPATITSLMPWGDTAAGETVSPTARTAPATETGTARTDTPGQPGFGVLAALIAVVLAAAVAYRV